LASSSGSPNAIGAVLLAFYELIHLNRQAFVGSLLDDTADGNTTWALLSKRKRKDTEFHPFAGKQELAKGGRRGKPSAEGAPLPPTLKQFIIFCSYIFQDMKVYSLLFLQPI